MATDRNSDPLIEAMGKQLAAKMPAENDDAAKKRVRLARSCILKLEEINRRNPVKQEKGNDLLGSPVGNGSRNATRLPSCDADAAGKREADERHPALLVSQVSQCQEKQQGGGQ